MNLSLLGNFSVCVIVIVLIRNITLSTSMHNRCNYDVSLDTYSTVVLLLVRAILQKLQ
jgi:hypothetical protein